jgi:hypothetical protein
VSARFLYAHRELRAAIEQLRDQQRLAPSPRPMRERASEASIRARLRGALEENNRVRAENTTLREELALAHGRGRELELDRRAGRR